MVWYQIFTVRVKLPIDNLVMESLTNDNKLWHIAGKHDRYIGNFKFSQGPL